MKIFSRNLGDKLPCWVFYRNSKIQSDASKGDKEISLTNDEIKKLEVVSKELFNGIKSEFDGIVDSSLAKENRGRAKKKILNSLAGFNCGSIASLINKLDDRDKFTTVGGNYSMLYSLVCEMRNSKSILCMFAGCDPCGIMHCRQFISDNLADHAIVELDFR